MSYRREVVIVQRRLTHYRVPLFETLRSLLAARGLQLRLLIGQGTSAEDKKLDKGELPWAEKIPTQYFLGDRLCWQPIRRHLSSSSLVIVTQENKLLQNHLLMLAPRRFKLAFWGHGANLQSSNPDGLKERFKRWTTNRVDWWFAYTQMSAELVGRAGFPAERITVLNNAVDTSELLRLRQAVTPAESQALREALGFGSGPVGVYVGSLYAEKRLDFLFAAAELIRASVPSFNLLLIGDGSERDKVQSWCAANPWARWVGARFGREKVAHISVAQVMLNPGGVGLGILDAFACGEPMVTTECGRHGPEVAYLRNWANGVMTENNLDAYVGAVVGVLTDVGLRERLQQGCIASARTYTVDNMASNFADSIVRCLEAPRYRGKL